MKLSWLNRSIEFARVVGRLNDDRTSKQFGAKPKQQQNYLAEICGPTASSSKNDRNDEGYPLKTQSEAGGLRGRWQKFELTSFSPSQLTAESISRFKNPSKQVAELASRWSKTQTFGLKTSSKAGPVELLLEMAVTFKKKTIRFLLGPDALGCFTYFSNE